MDRAAPVRLVVVGAGFGGLKVARSLAQANVEITVIDQRNHHTFQPLLYQVATAGLDADDICYATRGVFQRQGNARALQARVVGVDLANRQVQLAAGEPIGYDRLVLALGAVTADFGVSGVAEHCFGLKNADEAMKIRSQVLANFERAARSSDAALRRALLSVVVVGGGPTGVEMAGGLAELFARVLTRDFPEIDAAETAVVLVEGQDRLLSAFAPKLGDKAERRLRSMGVDVRLGTQVQSVTELSVAFVDEDTVETRCTVWAAGVRAHPMARQLGVETTRSGRVIVDDHLRLAEHPEVFVIGDLAAATTNGQVVPQVAAGAIQGGAHVAATIEAEIEGRATSPFRYRDKGSMATIGRNAAVVQLPGGRSFTGWFGWIAWLGLHLIMLIGFRNKANVLVNWAWNWLTYDRASRLIIEPDG